MPSSEAVDGKPGVPDGVAGEGTDGVAGKGPNRVAGLGMWLIDVEEVSDGLGDSLRRNGSEEEELSRGS